jgi:hypothetical protein
VGEFLRKKLILIFFKCYIQPATATQEEKTYAGVLYGFFEFELCRAY